MDNTYKYINSHRCNSSIPCQVCSSDIPDGALFCEKCGMRIHTHQLEVKRCEVNQPNQAYLASDNVIQPVRYGMHKLSEMPDLKKVVDGCKSSINTSSLVLSNLIDDYRERILDSISDVIAGDIMDAEVFETLGRSFIEERDFGLDRCTEAAKEIFNLGVMMSWANLPEWQRMEIMGVYAKEVAEAFELESYQGIVYQDLGEYVWGRNNGNGIIYLSNKLKEPECSPLRIIDTITHESRHQYQFEVVDGYHNVSEEVVNEWRIANQIYHGDTDPCCYDPWGYWYSPLEIDARYAGETVVRNVTHDLFNAKSAKGKNDIDLQQLRKYLIREGYSGELLDHTIENLLKLDREAAAAEMLHSWLEHGTLPEFAQIEGIDSSILREHGMKEPAIILSYGLLMNNPLHNSRYLKKQLSHKIHQKP